MKHLRYWILDFTIKLKIEDLAVEVVEDIPIYKMTVFCLKIWGFKHIWIKVFNTFLTRPFINNLRLNFAVLFVNIMYYNILESHFKIACSCISHFDLKYMWFVIQIVSRSSICRHVITYPVFRWNKQIGVNFPYNWNSQIF